MLKKKSIAAIFSSMLLAAMPMVCAAGNPLTLQESINVAMENNDQIKAASSGAEAAKWDFAKAKGANSLAVNFTHTSAKIGGEYWQTFHIEDDPSSYFVDTFSASVPIYTGGRIEHTIEQAKIGSEISDLQLKNIKQQVRYQVTQAYYMILACKNMQQAKTDAVVQLKEHLHNVQQQFAVGSVAKADVLRSEVALANAQQSLVTAENNTEVAIASFNKIVGRPIQRAVEITDDMSYIPKNYQLNECVEYALQHCSNLIASQKAVEQAKEEIEIAKSGKKPNVSFGASYTTYDTRVNEFDTKQWMVGVTANMNLFDGNVTSAQVNSAKAKLEQAKHQENDTAASVEFDVQQAYLNMKKSESNINTNKVAADKANEDFMLASARYGVKLGTNLDVVDAQVALTTARTAYIESLYDYNISKAALEKAMGLE